MHTHTTHTYTHPPHTYTHLPHTHTPSTYTHTRTHTHTHTHLGTADAFNRSSFQQGSGAVKRSLILGILSTSAPLLTRVRGGGSTSLSSREIRSCNEWAAYCASIPHHPSHHPSHYSSPSPIPSLLPITHPITPPHHPSLLPLPITPIT